jgi:hypothetical protein
MGGQVRIRIRYRAIIGPWFDYLFVSKAEMEELVATSGKWKIEAFLEDDRPFHTVVLSKLL